MSCLAPDGPAQQPATATIQNATRMFNGLSRSAIYREAGRGNIVLLKLGRTTLVDLDSVRAFVAGLPRATIRPPHTAG